MPRNHLPGASTLRNRIRITNKTRLKIHHGNLDADALLIPDEDEEKNRLTNLVAGVDAEDANEHHLQAVLSATQRNHTNVNRPTRSASDKSNQNAPPAAYIPTPDSTGIVDNYTELYPSNRWKDPATFLYSSVTVEESCVDGLANGFTYYMDERDKEWLDKNNEEARGEGTSAQGAISSSTTRTSARSAKAKGKEPEAIQPLVISEDEFELVMGLFEKLTHEQTEYLHHGLETGMVFPAFSEYQDTFSSPLPPPTFASYAVPSWIPPPANLVRIARVIYPYWKERRLERGGHRVIPVLNGDESDTLNESYVCFRRREIKAVRKTRASQATSSDKLIRLQAELAYPLDLAKTILSRENQKKEYAQHAQQVWERRLAIVDLRRKYPSLCDKADEELLVDKEKPKKSETFRPPKIRAESGAPVRQEVAMRPKERTALINEAIESILTRQKEQDHHWEDQVDNPYQTLPAPYPTRLYKYVSVNFLSAESDGKPILKKPEPRAVRLRRGRGGRLLVDRRDAAPRPIVPAKRSALFDLENMDVEMDSEDEERRNNIAERWRFDMDDRPAAGPDGADEQNRILVDDYSSKYLRHAMTLLVDSDQQSLMTDPSIPVMVEGRQQMVVPFRLGMPQPQMRRDAAGIIRPVISQGLQPAAPVSAPLIPPNGTPVSMQQPLKKMPPPTAVPQMRISSNGGMRPPASVGSMQSNAMSLSSPPSSAAPTQHSPPTTNGISRAAINMPHIDPVKPDINTAHSVGNGVQVQQPQPEMAQSHDVKVNGINVSPTKQSTHHHSATPVNGYHLTPLSSQAVAALVNPSSYAYLGSQHSLSPQQVQNLKSAFVNIQNGQELTALQNVARSLPASHLQVPGATNFNIQQLTAASNMNLKLPAARQMQWNAGTPTKVGIVGNGMDGSASPILGQTVPVRTPSANGSRPGMRIGPNGQLATHAMSPPHIQHSPSPMSVVLAQSQSPPRLPLTPTITRASPSLQHQQPGNSKSGY